MSTTRKAMKRATWKREHEFSTEIVSIRQGVGRYAHVNGGNRGAWSTRGGGRFDPKSSTLSVDEAVAMLLSWGVEEEELPVSLRGDAA